MAAIAGGHFDPDRSQGRRDNMVQTVAAGFVRVVLLCSTARLGVISLEKADSPSGVTPVHACGPCTMYTQIALLLPGSWKPGPLVEMGLDQVIRLLAVERS